MKAILLSIKPQYCELIASGEKTLEIRKSKPKLRTPFKCFIYCTKNGGNLVLGDRFDGNSFITEYALTIGYSRERANEIWGVMNGKVIGEFICDKVSDIREGSREETCLTISQWRSYTDYYRHNVYGWHISDLKIYDKPKELSEFYVAYKKAKNECSLKEKTKEGTMCIATESIFRGGCWKKSLIRPPQSWCYVEDIEE